MNDISIIESKDVNINEVAEFYTNIKHPDKSGRDLIDTIKIIELNINKMIDSYITHIIVARSKQGKLVGALFLSTKMSSLVLIDEWDPIVAPNFYKNQVGSKLIEKSKEFTQKRHYRNIRIFLGGNN